MVSDFQRISPTRNSAEKRSNDLSMLQRVIIVACVLLVFHFSSIENSTNKSCTTPMRTQGICVSINECKYLLETFLIFKREKSELAFETIKQSECGMRNTNILVCCDEAIMDRIKNNVTVKNVLEFLTKQNDNKKVGSKVMLHPNIKLLDHANCGAKLTRKVYGGKTTTVFEFPWMAMLMYSNSSEIPNRHRTVCSGTLISARYVLTAAHCITRLPPDINLVSVILGKHNTEKFPDCDKNATGYDVMCEDNYQEIRVEKVHYYPKFTYYNLRHDIGLIKLEKEAVRSRNVQPICLPIGTATKIEKPWMVTLGWGKTENSRRSAILRKVSLRLTSYKYCSVAYTGITKIWPDQLCAGGMLNKDSCQGDSGGPLQGPGLYNGDARWIQYGIVSFGKECGTLDRPGVYTNVTLYTKWILDTMEP